MKKLLYKLKKTSDWIIETIKTIFINVYLILTYYIIFGFFKIVISIFYRKLLNQGKKNKTYFIKSKDYQPILEECLRQS